MNDVMLVKSLQTLKKFICNFPYKLLLEALSRTLVLSVHDFMLSLMSFTCRSPPSANSISTQSSLVPSLKKDPSYLMTVGMLKEARRRI
jgi:hypothetical protein